MGSVAETRWEAHAKPCATLRWRGISAWPCESAQIRVLTVAVAMSSAYGWHIWPLSSVTMWLMANADGRQSFKKSSPRVNIFLCGCVLFIARLLWGRLSDYFRVSGKAGRQVWRKRAGSRMTRAFSLRLRATVTAWLLAAFTAGFHPSFMASFSPVCLAGTRRIWCTMSSWPL